MPAYQIQVRGTLNGATAFALPTIVPQPQDGGVIKIDAGVGINVGTFDLAALALTDNTPLWIRAIQVEYSALTRAARIQLDVSGSQARERIIPDQDVAAAVAPLMKPYILTPNAIAQVGALLTILTDDTDGTFTNDSVAGPHFVYIDVEPIRNDEQLTLIQDLEAFANAKSLAQGEQYSSLQLVAATATEIMGNVAPPDAANGDSARMMVQSIQVTNGAIADAGEDIIIAVQRVEVGTGSVTTIGTFTIDSTVLANSVSVVPIDQARNVLTPGDLIQVTRTYTAGMAPTPITNTLVRVQTVPLAF